jgi:hypothetical protein
MSDAIAVRPIPYDVSCEKAEEGEAETTSALIDTLRKIAETTFKDQGFPTRSVHAKTHGLLRGELRVLPGLAPELAQGLFATARPDSTNSAYPVVMRLSTVPGDLLPDSVSTPRGLAIKVIGVEGPQLSDTGASDTNLSGAGASVTNIAQDFVLVDGPAFGAPDAKSFLKNLKLLASTTDKGESLKKGFSALARVAEKAVASVSGPSPTLVSLGGHPETHILGETFYTQVPILYGKWMAKLCVAPVSPELVALAGAPLNVNGKPDGLRQAVIDHFARTGGEWEVRVQLCTDLEAMPIENASTIWPEDQSPYRPVARITVAPQAAWSEARAAALDAGLSFSPWHGLAAHRPLGSIMRVRKAVYETMAAWRSSRADKPVSEPRSAADLPD